MSSPTEAPALKKIRLRQRRRSRQCPLMLKLCIFVGSAVLGYGFWWAADLLGCDLFSAFVISGVGTLVGCWAGWKIHQRFFNS